MNLEQEIREKKALIYDQIKDLYELKSQLTKSKESRIRYASPIFDHHEVNAVLESLFSGWLGAGENVDLFQKKFAEFIGQKYGLFVNSGSSANLIAVSALCSRQLGEMRLKPGDEVITPALTFPTTLNPIIKNQLIPVFVDISIDTMNVNPTEIKKAITPKTRLLLLPHTLGIPNELDEIMAIKEKNALFLIEDACDALGSQYKGKMLGSFGEFATFSFYPAHHMTTAEGGMIVSNKKKFIRIAQQLRDWGRGCYCQWNEPNPLGACGRRFDYEICGKKYDHKYIYEEIGYNLKPTEMQGAFAIAQFEKVPEFIRKRKKNYEKLFHKISAFKEYFLFPGSGINEDISWFSFPLIIRNGGNFSRSKLVKWLENSNIETRLIFGGNILYHPAYSDMKYKKIGKLSNTNNVFENAFFLGLSPTIDDEDIERIQNSFINYFKPQEGNYN